jgi:trehalose 6-phosphate synthase
MFERGLAASGATSAPRTPAPAEIWTAERVRDLVTRRLGDGHLIVVSNREPYLHELHKGEIRWVRPASGLVTAVDPIMRAVGGTWIAHGSGSADRKAVDPDGRVMVPPTGRATPCAACG